MNGDPWTVEVLQPGKEPRRSTSRSEDMARRDFTFRVCALAQSGAGTVRLLYLGQVVDVWEASE